MRNTDFDTKLIIYKSRRTFMVLAVLVMTGVFTFLIMKNEENAYPWFVLIMPVALLGLLFLAFPLVEEWEYKPWQSHPRKVEQQER